MVKSQMLRNGREITSKNPTINNSYCCTLQSNDLEGRSKHPVIENYLLSHGRKEPIERASARLKIGIEKK